MPRRRRDDEQLTLDVVGEFDGAEVEVSTFKLPPVSTSKAQAQTDDRLKAILFDDEGLVIAEVECRVGGIAFDRHDETAKSKAWVERIHRLKPIA